MITTEEIKTEIKTISKAYRLCFFLQVIISIIWVQKLANGMQFIIIHDKLIKKM